MSRDRAGLNEWESDPSGVTVLHHVSHDGRGFVLPLLVTTTPCKNANYSIVSYWSLNGPFQRCFCYSYFPIDFFDHEQESFYGRCVHSSAASSPSRSSAASASSTGLFCVLGCRRRRSASQRSWRVWCAMERVTTCSADRRRNSGSSR